MSEYRRISRKLKGKVSLSCVTPADMYGLDTVALKSGKRQENREIPRKWRGKGGEEDRERDGKTASRELWKERDLNSKRYDLETVDKQHSETNMKRAVVAR